MTPERIEYFLAATKKRLKYYGLEIEDGDTSRDCDIKFSIARCDFTVCDFCNIEDLPTSVDFQFIDMCACDYLAGKLSSGQMPIENVVRIAQSIKVGDTEVSYGNIGAVEKVLLEYMTSKSKDVTPYGSFRKMRW